MKINKNKLHFASALVECILFFVLSLGASLGQAAGAFDKLNADAQEALYQAIRMDNPQEVSKQLRIVAASLGAGASSMPSGDDTPLIFAIKSDSFVAAQVIIGSKVGDLNRTNSLGETALMLASIKQRPELVAQLLKLGAEVNKIDWTALHYAATREDAGIVQALLDADAYIDTTAPNGNTPLHMAAGFGSDVVIKLLLDSGADASVVNLDGQSAAQVAQQMQRPDNYVKLLDAAYQTAIVKNKNEAAKRGQYAAEHERLNSDLTNASTAPDTAPAPSLATSHTTAPNAPVAPALMFPPAKKLP